MAGFKNSQATALEFIYKSNLAMVRNYVKKNNGTDADAMDIFQEAVIATWLNVKDEKYQPATDASLGAYIFQIAKYKWLDRVKSKRYKTTMRIEADELENKADESMVQSETAEDNIAYMQSIYVRLGDKCKEILNRFYYDKKSLEEIGVELQYDATTLRTMKYRCMMQLRKMHIENKEKSKQ